MPFGLQLNVNQPKLRLWKNSTTRKIKIWLPSAYCLAVQKRQRFIESALLGKAVVTSGCSGALSIKPFERSRPAEDAAKNFDGKKEVAT
jgi:hypothetical protein